MLSSDVRWCVCASCRKCLGAAWVAWPGWALPASVVKPRGSLEAVLSPRAIWILYLAAGGPQRLGISCLPSQDPSCRGFGEAEVCPGGATQALRVLPCPAWGFRHWAHRAEPLASEMFLSGHKGPNPLDSRIAKEGKHSGSQSFSHCSGPG